MIITHFQKNLSPREEAVFSKYIEQKTKQVGNLLTKFADDAATLRISIEKYDKHDAYEVEFSLALPSKSIVAKEASHVITKAVDLSKDRLISQIKKHMEMLRGGRTHKSIRTTERVKKDQFEFMMD